MRTYLLCFSILFLAFGNVNAQEAAKETGFEPLFDGKTLENWDGNPEFWSVKDGTITGQTTKDKPTKGNTFIIYRGGELKNFELRFDYKIIGGNSGVQYRSFEPNAKNKSGLSVVTKRTSKLAKPIRAFCMAKDSAASWPIEARKPN